MITKLSNFPFATLKTAPKVSDNKSTSLLLQGSYIRQAMAGAYEFLPMGYRVYTKIEQIIREEMDRAGYHEMLMTILTPKEYWETTGRWEIDDYFKVPGHSGAEYRIAPTNEENVTPIMKEFIQSYKDLPTCVYHIQKKFRNEKRAKSGLLRGREFTMKDAYSFHANKEDFDEFYAEAKNVYMRIFERLGLGKDTVIADADGGAISDQNSHEFQTFLEVGEDIIVQDSTGYCYNLELASGIPDNKNTQEEEKEMGYIETPDSVTSIDGMSEFFGEPTWKMLKTVVYKTAQTGKFFGITVRGDLKVNELKIRQFIKNKYSEDFMMATEEDLISLGTARGYVSPIKGFGLEIDFYGDESLKTVKNFIGGGKLPGKDTVNVNLCDMSIGEFGDFVEPIEGFLSQNIEGEKLTFRKASEVGNIFHLGDKYTKPFKVNYLDENNKTVDKVEMGCYGIGVSRLMGVMAEYFMTEKGITWPEAVAPYDYYIIVIGEESLSKATEIAQNLERAGNSVILDERMGRKAGFGQKAGDCELWGIPNRIVISPKTLEKGGYELKMRGGEDELVVMI